MAKSTKFSSFLATLFWVAAYFVHSSSLDSPPFGSNIISGNCSLDFGNYTYQPTGACIGSQVKFKQWNTLFTTLCCRNIVFLFSQALALRLSINNSTSVFLSPDLWALCSNATFLRQPSVSAAACGLDGDKFSSGTSKCSRLTLPDVTRLETFALASDACSHAGLFNGTTEGEEACTACARAVANLTDRLSEKHQGDGDKKSGKSFCGVAAVVSVASVIAQNRSQTEDFFQCLRTLDKFDEGYIKIKNSLAHMLVAFIAAISSIMLMVVLVKHVMKKKAHKPPKSKEYTNAWSGLYGFSKEEIDKAIYYENERKILGRGSSGLVYKGKLPSGQEVAIKHIVHNNNQTESFKREVEGLSRIRHPNLVGLLGYCMEEDGNYLVYEYCAGGNLAQQLLREDTLLDWGKRVRILRECALALRHLHNCYIVHRDIKLTNILLTEEMVPKLSDFGLARVMNLEETNGFTAIRGTIGYMDPEYMSNAKLTSASDVYSFGIVTLQILSGQRVFDLDVAERDQLTRKAKDVNSGNRPMADFVDPRLNGKVNEADFKSILQTAVLCVAKSGETRPSVEDFYKEMDKAWRNTSEYKKMKKAKHVPSASSTTLSTSTDGAGSV